MAKPKPLSKEMILAAMAKTKSARSCARALHVSYQHFKRYAKMYKDEETGESLFDIIKNPSGKGIPKFLKHTKKEPVLLDIMEGRLDPSSFNPDKLKYRLIEEGYLKEECAICGFNERRVSDYKIPLLLHFKDKNKSNYSQENIELLCYNHYFLYINDVFTEKDVEQIEGHKSLYNTTDGVKWELDDYQLEKLKELGLEDDDDEELNKYISRI